MEKQQPNLEYSNSSRQPPSRPLLSVIFWITFLALAFKLLVNLWPQNWVIPGSTQVANTRDNKTKSILSEVKQALELFKMDAGRYPTEAEGLDALVHAPPDMSNWESPYMDRMPIDGWGNSLVYAFPNPFDWTTYELHSVGPDGIDGTADDVTMDMLGPPK